MYIVSAMSVWQSSQNTYLHRLILGKYLFFLAETFDMVEKSRGNYTILSQLCLPCNITS